MKDIDYLDLLSLEVDCVLAIPVPSHLSLQLRLSVVQELLQIKDLLGRVCQPSSLVSQGVLQLGHLSAALRDPPALLVQLVLVVALHRIEPPPNLSQLGTLGSQLGLLASQL